jgi:hypothetical protein
MDRSLPTASRLAGPTPDAATRLRQVHAVARLGVAFVFLWHGLVPKLIYRNPDEAVMLTDGGISAAAARMGVTVAGVGEVLLGVVLLLAWRVRSLFLLVIGLMAFATIGVALNSPRFLTHAFNPVTLNLSVAALAASGWVASRDLWTDPGPDAG